MRVQLLMSDTVASHEQPARRDECVKPTIVSLLNNAVKRDVMEDPKRDKEIRERTADAKECCSLKEGEGYEKMLTHREHVDLQRRSLPEKVLTCVR